VKMSTFSGDPFVQINNPDPFAVPVWRSPVHHTPGWLITIVQLLRLIKALIKFLVRHPLITLTSGLLAWSGWELGWPGPVLVLAVIAVVLGVWWWRWRASFRRHVLDRMLGKWRRWHYQRHWAAVMTIGRLAPVYQGRLLLPLLGKVTSTPFTDRVLTGIVSGQSAEDFARRSEALAHGFGALLCRVRSSRPGWLVLEFVRRDALAAIIPALPIPAHADLNGLAIGRREDGQVWAVRLHGTHLLVAGATGAGKGSIIWGLIRALFPALQAGVVQLLGADPKRMELSYGREIFDTHGAYAADPAAILAMLEDAVADMQDRAESLGGKQRDHTPTVEHPFVVIIVDEVAFLTAYHPDKNLRDKIKAALATLTTQGRAVGYCVVAALQDPRKEVMSIRNLFPDRIAMRLDEPEQVDMVLGDGARDRGAAAELISSDPAVGAGVAFVRLESDPDPVRVRSAWVADADIRAMAASCGHGNAVPLAAIEAGAAA
jgi:DNA segregation ATPase FtsK/SpoIIIE, S-DNA-T family